MLAPHHTLLESRSSLQVSQCVPEGQGAGVPAGMGRWRSQAQLGAAGAFLSHGRSGSCGSPGSWCPLLSAWLRTSAGTSAAELVNTLSRDELTAIFRKYGEERFAWSIAGAIVNARAASPVKTTHELVELIRQGIPAPAMRKMNGHPARKVFQALRIAVNDELGALEQGMKEAFSLLAQEGRLIIVTYHSLEDRLVKYQFREWSEQGLGTLEPRKAEVPGEEEIERNPKSRSARLRGFFKKDLPDSAKGRMGPWRRV